MAANVLISCSLSSFISPLVACNSRNPGSSDVIPHKIEVIDLSDTPEPLKPGLREIVAPLTQEAQGHAMNLFDETMDLIKQEMCDASKCTPPDIERLFREAPDSPEAIGQLAHIITLSRKDLLPRFQNLDISGLLRRAKQFDLSAMRALSALTLFDHDGAGYALLSFNISPLMTSNCDPGLKIRFLNELAKLENPSAERALARFAQEGSELAQFYWEEIKLLRLCRDAKTDSEAYKKLAKKALQGNPTAEDGITDIVMESLKAGQISEQTVLALDLLFIIAAMNPEGITEQFIQLLSAEHILLLFDAAATNETIMDLINGIAHMGNKNVVEVLRELAPDNERARLALDKLAAQDFPLVKK